MNSDSFTQTQLGIGASFLGVDTKYAQLFRNEDPFNLGVVVEGALSTKPDHTYGSMVFLEVGGQKCSQHIRATPKIRYPFDRGGAFRFPSAHDIHCYEKLDGTNVLSYSYDHPDGGKLISHKLRLAPFVRNGRWGEFLDMWNEMLSVHRGVSELVLRSGCNISFEMYGRRNEHLIKYESELSIALLFGIGRAGGEVIPPYLIHSGELPVANLIGKASNSDDLVLLYGQMRGMIELGNKKEEDGKISGREGAVWYLREPSGAVSIWKCKPESVEEIHWATGINKPAVMATCWNVFESSDKLDYDSLEPLLLEEYQHDDILKFRGHIDECISRVNADSGFRKSVKDAYGDISRSGLDIHADKGAVMRILSAKFPRDQMTKVYGAIIK